MATLGQFIREHRVRCGITQPDLAAEVGLHQPGLSDIENDKRVPSALVLARLSRRLGFDLGEALDLLESTGGKPASDTIALAG
jgi:transcriptional regulator with XRE-family HTH domain